MATRRNKKILCFVDESGTVGAGPFAVGAVFVRAADAGRLDKRFSDLLPASTAEVHASELSDSGLQSLLHRLHDTRGPEPVVLLNQQFNERTGAAPLIYARCVVEVVKIGMKRFRDVLGRETLNNVDLIIDANDQNEHPAFMRELEQARVGVGRFRGINSVVRLDSGASRLLQLADVVAYAHRWIGTGDVTASGLSERYGVELR